MPDERPLKILILAAEIVPFAKVGGLADVVGALPKSFQSMGHDIRLAMPRYGQVDPVRFDLKTILDSVTVNMSTFNAQVSVRQGSIGNAIPVYANTATVYTIHNLAYQGIFGYRILEVAGVASHGFLYPQITELANVVDMMGRGILFADAITTVSTRYAQEILTPTFGEKLDHLLRSRRERLFGILNGLDYEEMNPATDRYIQTPFTINSLDKRAENKEALQEQAHLPVRPDVPLLAMISRLADQKGFDLLGQIIHPLLAQGVQFVLLGIGDQHYHEMFQSLAARYPEQVAIFLTFNTELAQRIYAGSDMFLMPSRFEPCGLGQLIAMRYGSVPIVRAVGGLADTVQEYDPRTGEGNGFAFTNYDPWELFAAIVRALELYRFKDIWRTLQQRGMAADHSWHASAMRYVDVYRNAIAFHKSGK